MPVSVQSTVSGPFIPNEVTTAFPFTFKAVDESDVIVVDENGTELSTALYSVEIDDDEGGTVRFSVAPSDFDYAELYIVSDPPLTSSADFSNGGPAFNPASLTQAFDRAAVRDLYLKSLIDRAAKVPFGNAGPTLPAKTDIAGKFLVGNADGDLVASEGGGADAALRSDLAASSGASLIGHSPTGAAASRSVNKVLSDWISAKEDGALGDGATDDRAALQTLIDRVSVGGGGKIIFPRGTFLVGDDPDEANAIRLKSGVTLVGDGPGASVIKLADHAADASGCIVVTCEDDVENIGVRDLTIDGNRTNQTNSSHCLRTAGGDGFLFQNLHLLNAYSYGYGAQDGTHVRLKMSDILIDGTGADGLDFKNKGAAQLDVDAVIGTFSAGETVAGATSGATGTVVSFDGTTLYLEDLAYTVSGGSAPITDFIDNEEVQVGGVTQASANGTLYRGDNFDLQFANITVRNWGLRGLSNQAAVDIRGPANISNLTISDPGSDDAVGLRLRQGETLDANGQGGHRTHVTDFDIRMGGKPTAIGITAVARDVVATAGFISGGLRGVQILDSRFTGTGISVDGASDHGFDIAVGGSGLDGDDAVLTGCRARNCGDDGFNIAANRVQLLGCTANGCTGAGSTIESTADRTFISGGDYSGNGSTILDGGTNTRINVPDVWQSYTVASLATRIPDPVPNQRAYITDATATTFASTPTGGGSNKVPVYHDGSGWKIG